MKQREISYSYIQPEVTYKMSMERKKIREMDLDGAMDNPGYKESLRSILQGSGISVRHQLFQEKKERSSHPISQLWKMAGTEFLDGGSAADLLVQTKLRKFFVDEFEEADDIIKNMVPKMTMEEISMEYTSLVLQPEFMILILKDLGLTSDEAEASYQEVVVDQEEREQLKEDMSARAKELQDEENDAVNSSAEWVDV